ncbi:hypothetical protein P12x_000885 [Tundrisphaera lichenicola]|uniref:hypothetical protein n=1 Tax=Tundrisphaera lichenicola TaxID=2029860 RepID=UPI003EC11159
MRRTVEKSRSNRGRGGLAFRTSAIGIALASSNWAVTADEGPALTPPVEMPRTAKPATPPSSSTRSKPATPPAGRSRAVLALPGITTPSARPPSVITSTPSRSASVPVERPATPGELNLDAPLEMPLSGPGPRSGVAPSTDRPSNLAPLDLLPMEESTKPYEPEPPKTSSSRGPATSSRTTRPTPPTVRRGRFFGLIPGPVAAPPGNGEASPGRAVAERSSEDPAIDSALKRRVEKQAREAVGDRARQLDVRVVGKDVAIRARGVRFLQKRAVRKSLESLPVLSGVRSTIQVDD